MIAKHADDNIDNRRKAFLSAKVYVYRRAVLRIYSNRKQVSLWPGTERDTGTGQASEI